jgi:hypothetical protein
MEDSVNSSWLRAYEVAVACLHRLLAASLIAYEWYYLEESISATGKWTEKNQLGRLLTADITPVDKWKLSSLADEVYG